LAAYLLHHLGSLYQYHDGDFTHWINEAKAAMSMAPYETLSRSDLPSELANAGEAIAWAEQAVSTLQTRLHGTMKASPGLTMSARATTTR
jgi:hypothetical protein